MPQNTNDRRKHILSLFPMIAILIAATVFLVAYLLSAYQEEHPDKQETSASFNTTLFCDTAADEDWCLVLVNKWHPIETNREIEVTELSNGQCVDSRLYPELQKMFDDMRKDGVYPVVASGYRTQQEQQRIYDETMQEYLEKGYSKADAKAETERWVAVPGTSEHQLGLGIDINADGVNSSGEEVYNWLAENAHRYGFIYRYPPDKTALTGIENEPWHYRYVGITAATEIYMRGICLEEYLAAS